MMLELMVRRCAKKIVEGTADGRSQMSKSRCKNLAWDLNISEGVGDPDADPWPRSGNDQDGNQNNQI